MTDKATDKLAEAIDKIEVSPEDSDILKGVLKDIDGLLETSFDTIKKSASSSEYINLDRYIRRYYNRILKIAARELEQIIQSTQSIILRTHPQTPMNQKIAGFASNVLASSRGGIELSKQRKNIGSVGVESTNAYAMKINDREYNLSFEEVFFTVSKNE